MAKQSELARDSKYQGHIHVFRGVAIILIVFAHTVPSLDWSESVLAGKIIDAIANQSSIFFFFIAGYLFQHLSGRFSYKKYLKQKLKTVILPYLLLSIPALYVFTVLTERVGMWPWFYGLEVWEQVGLFLLTGKHLALLWFVPTITLFYIAAPLLVWIDRRLPVAYWLIIPLLVISTFVGRDGQLGPINKAVYLFPAYWLGMAFSHWKAAAISLVDRWWWLLLIISVVAASGVVLEWEEPPYWQMPMKAALVLLITWVLYYKHQIFGGRLDYIAEVSFGIFFIHAYCISAIKVGTIYIMQGVVYDGREGDAIAGSVLTFGAYAAAVLAVTLSVIWTAKRVLGSRSRMFIGA